MPFSHQNSKGQTYFLRSEAVTLRNGRTQTIFFFAREPKKGQPVETIPSGFQVEENTRTGLPFLKKQG